jgi:hypothetical protein
MIVDISALPCATIDPSAPSPSMPQLLDQSATSGLDTPPSEMLQLEAINPASRLPASELSPLQSIAPSSLPLLFH